MHTLKPNVLVIKYTDYMNVLSDESRKELRNKYQMTHTRLLDGYEYMLLYFGTLENVQDAQEYLKTI